MKYNKVRAKSIAVSSHPARGAWIEITNYLMIIQVNSGRTPQGVRGLKCIFAFASVCRAVVAPRKGCVD